jgi:hypothetical protein
MKNLMILATVLAMAACTSGETGSGQMEATDPSTASSQSMEGIGFNTMLPDMKFHLGTEEAIQVVKDLDEKWTAKDYEGMRTFFADTAEAYFPDGRIAHNGDEIVQMIEDGDEEAEVSWTFDYAYSVDLDPTRGGEHVQAGFTGTSTLDGVTEKKHYHEWYYVVEGKIVFFRQYTMDILPEEE